MTTRRDELAKSPEHPQMRARRLAIRFARTRASLIDAGLQMRRAFAEAEEAMRKFGRTVGEVQMATGWRSDESDTRLTRKRMESR